MARDGPRVRGLRGRASLRWQEPGTRVPRGSAEDPFEGDRRRPPLEIRERGLGSAVQGLGVARRTL